MTTLNSAMGSPSQPTGEVFICKEQTLVDDVCKMQASTPQSGEIRPEDCALDNEELTRPQSQEPHAMGCGARSRRFLLRTSGVAMMELRMNGVTRRVRSLGLALDEAI